jgi:hypothetical protein
MQTRRRAQAEAWIAQLEGAAELPSEVQQVILQHIIAAVAAAAPVSDASVPATGHAFAQLDGLRRVCRLWSAIISRSPAFLDLLWTEKFCLLERMAWTRLQISSKRLPSSFSLPYLQDTKITSNSLQESSSRCTTGACGSRSSMAVQACADSKHHIVNVRFKIDKSYKRAALFVCEPNPSSCTAQQAVAVLQKMCELEGTKMAMLFLLQCPAGSPEEWLQALKAGAAAISTPTTVIAVEPAEGGVLLHPKNEQHTFGISP